MKNSMHLRNAVLFLCAFSLTSTAFGAEEYIMRSLVREKITAPTPGAGTTSSSKSSVSYSVNSSSANSATNSTASSNATSATSVASSATSSATSAESAVSSVRSSLAASSAVTTTSSSAASEVASSTASSTASSAEAWIAIASTFTSWTDSGEAYSYSAWSPAISAQMAGFVQTRTHSQNQTRYEQAREMSSATGQVRNLGEPVLRTQTLTGIQDVQAVVATSGAWTVNGANYGCGAWTPDASTINYGTTFTQARNCSQNQARTWTYSVGGNNVGGSTESQVVIVSESQSAVGDYQNWVTTTSTFTSWTDIGTTIYGDWTPAIAAQHASFTQERSVKTSQERYEQKRELDSISAAIRNVGSPIHRTQNNVTTESRNIVATAGASTDTITSSYSAWSPASAAQMANYTQTQSASKSIQRVWTYTSNNVEIGSDVESQGTGTDTQSRSVIVTIGAWTASGPNTACNTWTPSASTYDTGVSFVQTRSCTQPQSRAITHDVNGITVYTATGTQSVTVSESQNAVGTNGVWNTATSTYTAWIDNGAAYNYGTWAPAFASQNKSFDQARNYTQPQTRTAQAREVNVGTGVYRNVGSPTQESRNLTKSELRTIIAFAETTFTVTNPTGYTPDHMTYMMAASDTSTVFAQTYTATQTNMTVFRFAEVNNQSNILYTWTRTDSSGASAQYRDVRVNAPNTWTAYGSLYNCGTWNPLASLSVIGTQVSQSRTCTQDSSRTQTFSDNTTGEVIGTTTGTKSAYFTDRQTISGTAPASGCSYWFSSGRQDAGFTATTRVTTSTGTVFWNGKNVGTLSGGALVTNDGVGPTTYTASTVIGSYQVVCKSNQY
jgi:hypothetical protein